MRDHLIFLLSAPMASFGSYAGHERRGSNLVPLRSAVLGLLGAALGLKRADTDGQAALRDYSIAVQSFQRSTPLRDYHTVQTIPTAKAKRPPTRRDAFARAGDDVNTIITIRDYRCDVLVGVTLWGEGQWTLDELSRHLQCPDFPLYLGRKSCPLAAPLNPRLVQVAGPVEALACIEVPEWLRRVGWSEEERIRHSVYSDPVDGVVEPLLSEQIPCDPLDRTAWTFGERTVWCLSGTESGGRA